MEQSPEMERLYKILADLHEKHREKTKALEHIDDQIDEVLAKIYDQKEREKV